MIRYGRRCPTGETRLSTLYRWQSQTGHLLNRRACSNSSRHVSHRPAACRSCGSASAISIHMVKESSGVGPTTSISRACARTACTGSLSPASIPAYIPMKRFSHSRAASVSGSSHRVILVRPPTASQVERSQCARIPAAAAWPARPSGSGQLPMRCPCREDTARPVAALAANELVGEAVRTSCQWLRLPHSNGLGTRAAAFTLLPRRLCSSIPSTLFGRLGVSLGSLPAKYWGAGLPH